jgi:hypothetical protein
LAASIRWIVWGRPAPLAVLAKPSDLQHGLVYALGAFALSGAFWAAFGPFALRRVPRWPRVLAIAAIVHLAVVALAGGDWMPLERLVTPVLPPLVLVIAYLLAGEAIAATFAGMRLVMACLGELAVFFLRGQTASGVLADRIALIDSVRPQLVGATRVATIDVGWVGAATEADIVDLAGATDPEIAALPGGHTSKAISGAFLSGRHPSHLVFELAERQYRSFDEPEYAREVEARLGSDPLVRRTYRYTWTTSDTLPIQYGILSLRPADPRTSDRPDGD